MHGINTWTWTTTWTFGTNTWTSYDDCYVIEYDSITASDSDEVEEFVPIQYVEEWFAPSCKPIHKLKHQCYGQRWFEHCRKRNGKDRIAQTIIL